MNRARVLIPLSAALSLFAWSCLDPNVAGDACDANGACRGGLTCCEGLCRADCGGGGGGGAVDGGGTGGGGGQLDAGTNDAGANDAGATDAGATDAGATDAGTTDAGMTDAGAAVDCDDLTTRYGMAVDAAKACNPNSLVNPCTEVRPSAIVCGCPTSINAGSGGPLDALEAEFVDAGCLPILCPRCVVFDGGSCAPVSGGGPNDGVCVDSR